MNENLNARWQDSLMAIRIELVSVIVKIDKLRDDMERRLKDGGKNKKEEKGNKEG